MNFTKDVWKPLPMPVKVVAIGLAGFGAYKGGKALWKKLNPGDQEQEAAAAQTEAERILKANASLPADQRTVASYSPAQMKTFANTLFSAMDGAGTDEAAVLGVFKQMNNDLDFLFLIDAFGVRHGSSWFATSTDSGLSDWLQSDGLTTAVNSLLETRAKITYRF